MVMLYALPLLLFGGTLGISRSKLFGDLPLALAVATGMIGSFFIVLVIAHFVFRGDLGTSSLQALTIGGPAVRLVGVSVLGYLFGSANESIPVKSSSLAMNVVQVPVCLMLLSAAVGQSGNSKTAQGSLFSHVISALRSGKWPHHSCLVRCFRSQLWACLCFLLTNLFNILTLTSMNMINNDADPRDLQLNCALSASIWRLLQNHSQKTDEPVSHIVSRALADYFQVSHSTLYQVSTATALVEGIYQGAVRVGTLREHGDLGLGTFENLDGEMVIVGGHFFQARSDGLVTEVDDDVLAPFAVITRFAPDSATMVEQCADLSHLYIQFDQLRHSDNFFFALRVDGHFDYVRTRAMCRTKEGVPLVQAAAVQPEFEFHNISGTLVGFWTPEYMKTLNVPGYHLHFLSADHRSGGHLLECSGANLRLQIQREGDYRIALPETEDFVKADLQRDPSADLAKAEGARK
jgi:acetolactate decarboxylase